MKFNKLQSLEFSKPLENEIVLLLPLQNKDFEDLFLVASDKEIWVQHPQNDRWKKEIFRDYFESAIQSNSAYLIKEKINNEIIGCTRFYNYTPSTSIHIGYTFLAKKYWGGKYNLSVKSLMINFAFKNLNSIFFDVGSLNIRSRKAVEKIGATLFNEDLVKNKCTYKLDKTKWLNKKISENNSEIS